jgi:hypothetical protein
MNLSPKSNHPKAFSQPPEASKATMAEWEFLTGLLVLQYRLFPFTHLEIEGMGLVGITAPEQLQRKIQR